MICCDEGAVRSPYSPSGIFESFERLLHEAVSIGGGLPISPFPGGATAGAGTGKNSQEMSLRGRDVYLTMILALIPVH